MDHRLKETFMRMRSLALAVAFAASIQLYARKRRLDRERDELANNLQSNALH